METDRIDAVELRRQRALNRFRCCGLRILRFVRRVFFLFFFLFFLCGQIDELLSIHNLQRSVAIFVEHAMSTDLSARRFRNRFRSNHHDFARNQPVFLRDHLPQLRYHRFHGFSGSHGVSELENDDKRFLPVAWNGDGGDGAGFDLWKQAARLFDVLWVIIAASHDEQIFGSATHVQFAVLCHKQTIKSNVEEPQVPRRQPHARRSPQFHREARAVIGVIPARHRSRLHVDLPHAILPANRRFPRDRDPDSRVFRRIAAGKQLPDLQFLQFL